MIVIVPSVCSAHPLTAALVVGTAEMSGALNPDPTTREVSAVAANFLSKSLIVKNIIYSWMEIILQVVNCMKKRQKRRDGKHYERVPVMIPVGSVVNLRNNVRFRGVGFF